MMHLDLYDSGDAVSWPEGWDNVDGLTNFLNKAWHDRPIKLFDDEEDEDERRYKEQKFFKLGSKDIRATKYVGVVQFGELRINVYPGVFDGVDGFEPDDKIWHVLKWLSYARRIHFPFSRVPFDNVVANDWLEALIYLFANYTHKILSATPHFAYQEVTEELAFVRGSIAMPEYIRDNLATGRHQHITCRYEPFLYDNLFNRIVKRVARLLQHISRSADNRQRLGRLLFLLEEVSDVHCTAADCDKVKVNRLFPEVDIIRNMSRTFLEHRSGSGGGNPSNFCLLLPMEVIFEQYVAGFLQDAGYEAMQQASGLSLAKTGEGFATNIFQMRHDILMRDRIIDTKYKFRTIGTDGKAGVSQGDMYQMLSYCYRRGMEKGMLLYPQKAGAAFSQSVLFKVEEERKVNADCKSFAGYKEIQAVAIDITEPASSRSTFKTYQNLKFSRLFDSIIAKLPNLRQNSVTK